MANTDWPHTHAALKVLHLLYRNEITYTVQPRFCKVDYRSVNVQCPNIIQYWWWFWRQWCRDVASSIDRHPDRTDCRYRVIESSSLVPVLFREVFSHPYISFFHLLVNGFSVISYSVDTLLEGVNLLLVNCIQVRFVQFSIIQCK